MSEELKDTEKKESIWSVPYVILILVSFFSSLSFFMTNTTVPILATELGASVSIVGVIVGTFPLAALAIRPFAGPAFDSFSRKRLLIFLEACASICLCLYGVTDSIPMLLAVRFAHGVFAGSVSPLTLSFVSEFLPLSKFASGISIFALANSCAQIVGPAVGLYLIHGVGFGPAYFLAGGCILVSMLAVFIIKEPYREHLKYELKWNRMFAKEAIFKAIPLLLLSISFSCVGSYVVLYGYLSGIMDMGFYFVVYACCLLATRPLFGKIADRVGTPNVVFFGILCFMISFITLSQARTVMGFALAAVIGSAGFGSCAPLLQSMALASVPNEYRGAASNTMFTGLDLGNLVGPIMGGMVIESLSIFTGNEMLAYSDMWLIMLIPGACALIFIGFAIFKRRSQRKAAQSKANANE